MAMSYKVPSALKYRKSFAEYVKREAKNQGWNLTPNDSQHFYVDTVFYFPKKGMDGNNYFKVMLDAITDTKLIWLDDDVVCERIQAIYYDAENPRVELTIYPVNYIGIFDSAKHLNEFTSRCKGCSRYSRNCSILCRAKEGRIQEEIKNYECSKYKERKE